VAAAAAGAVAAEAAKTRMRAATAILLGVALSACALLPVPDRPAEIQAALADLAKGGFRFPADVNFVPDKFAVCDGIACADVVLIENRRTVRLAAGAFQNPSKLRATLLDVWPRYELPRRPNAHELAESALLVVREGPKAGITDPEVIADARFSYRRLYEQLAAAQRKDLPPPDSLASR
jgi:hypothetical protein